MIPIKFTKIRSIPHNIGLGLKKHLHLHFRQMKFHHQFWLDPLSISSPSRIHFGSPIYWLQIQGWTSLVWLCAKKESIVFTMSANNQKISYICKCSKIPWRFCGSPIWAKMKKYVGQNGVCINISFQVHWGPNGKWHLGKSFLVQ